MDRILVVDDEKNVLSSFKRIFKEYEVITASNGREASGMIKSLLPNAVIMDIRMPEMDGLEVLKRIKEIDSRLPVIIMTAYGTTNTAIEAMKLGAFEYIIKPFDIDTMHRLVEKALETNRLMQTEVIYGISKEKIEVDRIVGNSSAMQRIYKLIGQVAQSDVTVLIRGESGTGKELVARAIYQHSKRKDKPFLAVNCAAIPETLLESELFGYDKGAFTGAEARRIGRFEQCNGGTIFLDEIGDMSLPTQAKILRILEQHTLERLGSNETVKVDIRVMAATNKDLGDMLKKSLFREDLYFRLNVISLNIPPLRERLEDISSLADYFLRKYSRELSKNVHRISKVALEALQGYNWPGNVRELENCVKRAILLGKGETLLPEHLELRPAFIPQSAQGLNVLIKNIIQEKLRSSDTNVHRQVMQNVEKQLIAETLKLTQGNQTQAAKILGITRPTLKEKIRAYSLRRKEIKIQED